MVVCYGCAALGFVSSPEPCIIDSACTHGSFPIGFVSGWAQS